MITKLKLQIDFSNIMDISEKGKLTEEYRLYITFLDVDDRFEATNVGQVLSHNGTGTFVIKSLWDEKMGGMIHNGLLLPNLDRVGLTHNKLFDNDMHRYSYLKRLYNAIEEWANYWYGFKYDSASKLTVDGNIWEVTCDTIYTGPIRQISSDFVDEFDNEFEDEFEDNEDEEWIIL